MSGIWIKLDKELQIIYSNYLEVRDKGAQNVEWIHPAIEKGYILSVYLEFSGDIKDIEQLGFEATGEESDGEVLGDLDLKDMEPVAGFEKTISLSFGSESKMLLSTSTKEINVRGANKIWDVNKTTGKFSDTTGTGTVFTGKGVVIGIIDSGIDFNHPVFLETDSPKKKTRIRRIWDPGLRPEDGEKAPDKARIGQQYSYGVEYKDTMIDDVLQKKSGAKAVRHKDCGGHGTHVASIAAGDGRAPVPSKKKSAYEHIGVAPEADIVVVKVFDLIETPKKENDETKSTICYDQRFEDALNYILNVAKHDLGDKPVVINYSAGAAQGPGDGLTKGEKKLRDRFNNETGKIFVTAAGNDAGDDGEGNYVYGVVTIPAAGKVILTFDVYDKRTKRTGYDKCRETDDTYDLDLDIWYKDISPKTVEARLKLPKTSSFIKSELGQEPKCDSLGNGKRYTFQHRQETGKRPATDFSNAMDVKRNNISLRLTHKKNRHKVGKYTVELKGPKDTKLHVWCDINYKYGLKFGTAQPASALDIKIGSDQEHLINSPGGASNILTIAAYDDMDGVIASFSSRGPLMDYSNIGAYIDKPDIAAPGWEVDAAHSNDTSPPGKSPCCKKTSPPGYKQKDGTSMSAPHVAGVAALLLQKKKTLTTARIIELITTKFRAGTPPGKDTFGAGKVDAKEALKNVP
ncbi:MAG: S8 family serine peptidase [bacterium]|nr:S8 family serine peptidase [bacterium]